ncbi:MAG: aldo/keto reductase [Brevundimonas sp.]|uniref:aldo/keto reductase n=1 Tax=Brevundimonas sp. TaxID=1871086 RepID=UPI00276D9246|nr:aldo/keto reductase [Brevundimonas sp.]MDP3401391.1 aldo/keto reductase [Brevundimonas sp.]MDZ4109874.1 aldo/keto reductase [Brevundimonas sp.]
MTAAQRRASVAGISLSPLTFGSMRVDRVGDADAVARLIEQALDLGVTTFHVSSEYATWPLFQDAWRTVRPDPATTRIIAKVGVPHFGETRFDPQTFADKIDQYRAALNVDRIAVVQWLLRHDLKDEPARLAILDDQSADIADCVTGLKASGTIGAMVSFPYTRGIAERALDHAACDGLALYCNPLELEMTDLFDQAGDRGKAVVAIRPFAAGRLFTETTFTARDALAVSLAHPAVATVVASVSSSARLNEIADIAMNIQPDAARWRGLIAAAQGAADV